MRIISRLSSSLLAALVVALLPSPASAQGPVGGARMGTAGTVQSAGTPALPAVSSPSFVVADLDTGAVYAARNPHAKALPASCLKVLTALVLLPQLNPNHRVIAQASDVNVDGTRVGIVPGGGYPIGMLFQGLLMVSGNDAAMLLARTNGGVQRTLDQMNATARRLQADDTHAATPSGLEGPGQSTSAYDLALFARAAMQLPAFRSYVSTRRATFGAIRGKHFEIDNKNHLLRMNYPGALGIKDGWTTAALHTFVGAATRGGRTYLVTMVRTDRTYGEQTAKLLDWAFALPRGATPVGRLVDPLSEAPFGQDQSAGQFPSAGPAGAAGSAGSAGAAGSAAIASDATPDGSGRRRSAVRDVAGSLAAVVLAVALIGVMNRRRLHRRQPPGPQPTRSSPPASRPSPPPSRPPR